MIEEATLPASATPTSSDVPLPKISGYTLLREKGRGPKATVYKARRVFENDVVAIKLFHRGLCDRTLAAKLEAAIENTAKLQHNGLIRALGFGTDAGNSFLVLEYASGESLSNFLFRRQQFPPAKALSVVLYCAQTLKYAAEQGFIHGRLHPGRIVLGKNSVRIAGVGMGERPEHAAWTVQYPHLFEPLVYTPPEAMPSRTFPEKNAEAVDVFALGAILYHLLICMPPYKGNDEGSVLAERSLLKRNVDWPDGAREAFSPALPALIESMLDPDPAKRPNCDQLITSLSTLQTAAHKSGEKGWSGAAAGGQIHDAGTGVHPTSDVIVEGGKTVAGSPMQFSTMPMRPAPTSSDALVATVPQISAEKNNAPLLRQVSNKLPAVRAKRTGFDVFFSTLLFCMTTLVFLGAAYVTAQPYLPEKYQMAWLQYQGKNGTTQPATNGSGTAASVKPADPAATPATPVLPEINPLEEKLANRQLDKIQEMLRDSEILPSNGLAKVLRGIAERAGRDSSTGMRALILAGEIESRMATGRLTEPLLPVAPAPNPAPVQPPAAKTDAPPAPFMVTPVPTDKPKTPAVVAPPPAPAAPKAIPGVADVAKQTRKLLKYFGYVKAKDALEQFAAKGDSDQKKVAADYKVLVNYEEGLYERTRSKLLDHIKKDPKHESLLQVFPRKDDPTGDDIIDFDEKGLHILVRGGKDQGVKITPWDKFPAAQLLNLLTPLTSKDSLEDQLGLAVFAFNRNLKAETDDALGKAEKIAPNGKEKADTIANTFQKITRALDAPE